MDPKELLATAVVMALSTAMVRGKSNCDVMGGDLYGAVDRFFTMLPENYMPGAPSFTPLVAGIEIGKVNVSGLNRLRRYGALRPHCRNGGLLVQADVINNGDVVMSVPWRTCSGKTGTLRLRAQFSRFAVELHFDDFGLGHAFLFPEEGMRASHAVVTVEPSIVVVGAGDAVRAMSAGFSRVLSAPLVELWNVYFLRLFKEAVNDVGNGVLPL